MSKSKAKPEPSKGPAYEALLAFAKAYVALFRDSDMRPEDECHELLGQAKRAIAKATRESP